MRSYFRNYSQTQVTEFSAEVTDKNFWSYAVEKVSVD